MTKFYEGYEAIFEDMLESARIHISDISPSEWYAKNMVMPRGSAFPGPFSFDSTPYWKEPLDCCGKNHPAKEISIMKGAQLGGTAAVLNPIVGYTISQNPGNIMFLTGHSDLTQAAFVKIDDMINNANIRHLIRPNVIRPKNSRSGDTDSLKEFPGGSLWGGSVTNHNLLRQYDVMIMIVDDFDAAPPSSKAAGDTRSLVQHRTAAYALKKKIIYVSSPQLQETSNIYNTFKMGDQRYWNVPCPLCGSLIVLKWKIEKDGRFEGGITWKVDGNNNIERGSVGYVCQECAGFFTDSHKYEMNLAGQWVPTVIPKEENHYSYQISSLYAPPFMDNWSHYVQQFINIQPPGGKSDQKKAQTFYNVVLGEPFIKVGKEPEANAIQRNTRTYEIGTIPEWISEKDGNGKIVMLTCAADLNGLEKDARMDYEILAWSESGSSYSIRHGSIGTFVPREGDKKDKEDRVHWTYEHNKENSVWPELKKIIQETFSTDTGRKMKVLMTGIDTGYQTKHVYDFIDKCHDQGLNVIGVRGDKENQYRKYGIDAALFKKSKERARVYMLDVNMIKDQVANCMELKWLPGAESQPPGFMNYPVPSGQLYTFNGYFSHYQAEHTVTENKDGEPIAARWVKKPGQPQNHFWDVYVYGYVLKEIWADIVLSNEKPARKGNWSDFVQLLKLNRTTVGK